MQGSFILSDLQYIDSHAEVTTRIGFRRSLIAPQINYIGGLILRWTETKPLRADEECTRYNLQDGWLGRAFSLGRNPAGGPGRTKLTLSGRAARTDYELRPAVRADTNRTYHDRILILGSLTLSRNDYRTSRLIYSYGTTEDIPIGYLAAVTAGAELNEFEHLPYLGVDLYGGNYWEGFGFLNTRLRVGSYVRNDRFENTAVDFFQGYFTDLLEVGNCYLRQFIRASYTAGYRRFEDDRVELDRFTGIYGLGDTGRRGKQRLVLYYEPLLFTPLDLFTFRLAFFAFASAGTVADDLDRLFTSRYYTSLGVGFRFHSERLVFDAMEFRLIFYPSIPEDLNPDWYDFGTVPTLPIPGFSPGKPSTVGYK
jgi:hypothetical protein